MIPNYNNRVVKSGGVTASGQFGISVADSAHLMTILRDTLYSDKILAVLREYSANAWDAQREAGRGDQPIKITLPTKNDPSLYIEDYGTGLSEADVFNVYAMYGASTKRKSNTSTGMLGIGAKSGFAYSDSFTLISRFGGKKKTFVSVLDSTNIGTINLIDEEDWDVDTGMTVQIPVKPSDIWEFTQKAQELFKYFSPRPTINTKLAELSPDRVILKHGVLNIPKQSYHATGGWVALMGCIPYRIDMNQVTGSHQPEGGVGSHVNRLSGVLYFNMGEVEFAASREELKYGDNTKKAIVLKFNDLIDEYVKVTLDALENEKAHTVWERRIRAQVLTKLGLPVPKGLKDTLLQKTIDIKSVKAKSFTLHEITEGRPTATEIDVSSYTRLLFRDDLRTISGFRELATTDILVQVVDGFTWGAVELELEEVIKRLDIHGIPQLKLSTFQWTPKFNAFKQPKTKDPKHSVTTFTFKPNADGGWYYSPWSRHWEISKRVPRKDDVFAILHAFGTEEEYHYDFYRHYSADATLAEAFGVKMPTVYGYKSTVKRRVSPEKCKGTHYPEWRKQFVEDLLTAKNKKLLAIYEAVEIVKEGFNIKFTSYAALLDQLGVEHPISLTIRSHIDAKKEYQKLSEKVREGLKLLHKRAGETMSFGTVKSIKELLKKYPLLEATGLSVLWRNRAPQWGDYVKMVDQQKKNWLTPLPPEEAASTENLDDDD